MNLDELERNMIRTAQRELAPSAADRERHEAELFARLGGGSGGPTPLGGGTGSQRGGSTLSQAALSPAALSPAALSRAALSQAALSQAALSRAALSRAALSRVALSVRSSRFGMLGLGMIVGAVVGGWFGFGLGRGARSAAGEGAREPVVAAASAVGADLSANAGPQPTPSSEAAALAPPSATGEFAAGASVDTLSDAPSLPGESPASVIAREPERGAGRVRGTARRAPAPGEASSLAAEVAMLQRARRALNAENGRLALGIVQELDEQFPNGVLLEERSATRVLSLCQLEQVDAARGAARTFLERYPASVYAERVRGSCGADPEE